MKKKLGSLAEEYLSLKSKSTQKSYRSGFRKFLKWYDGTLEDFLNTIYKEMQKPPQKQKRVAEVTANRWVQWLKDQGYSNNTVNVYFSALQNFLKYHKIMLSGDWIGNLPPATAKKENKKHEWKLEHIKEFFNSASCFRDKALILCMFQSGLGINEIVSLDYGDVRDELEEGTLPLCLSLVRKKTGEPFKTFFGRDAVKYLKLYLETRSNLKDDSPLFTMLGRETRITKGAIQARFRELAKEASFVKDRDRNNGYNPLRPHSLRSAFRSRLTGKMDGDLIEFLMGHAIGDVKKAYLNLPTDELRELYANHERFLSVEKTSKDELSKVTEEGKITEEYKQKVSRLERAVASLADEKEELKEDIQTLKKAHWQSMEKFKAVVDYLSNIKKEHLDEAYGKSLKEDLREIDSRKDDLPQSMKNTLTEEEKSKVKKYRER